VTDEPSAVELAIAKRAAGLIEDGATLQVGIGTLPAAILSQLGGHRELGLHTGALMDEAAALVARESSRMPARASMQVSPSPAWSWGAVALKRWARPIPRCSSDRWSTPTPPTFSRAWINLVAINSAIEVDLTGQVNAEVAGGTYVGAVGGALDFLEGANRSRGGLPIIALPSTVGDGANTRTRIVSKLSGPVSTARSNVGIVITEHGAADLRGLSIHERLAKMISLAAPEFREQLAKDAFADRGLRPSAQLSLPSKPGIFALNANFPEGDRNA
jgi:acyl-CoA hydrolase